MPAIYRLFAIYPASLIGVVVAAASLILTGCISQSLIRMTSIDAAQQYYRTGEYILCISELENAISLSDSSDFMAQASYLKATCYEGLGNYKQASRIYEYIINNHPSSSYAFESRGRLEAITTNRINPGNTNGTPSN